MYRLDNVEIKSDPRSVILSSIFSIAKWIAGSAICRRRQEMSILYLITFEIQFA